YRADEIIGKHFSVFYPPEEARRGKPAYALQTALEDGHWQEDGWRIRKDGTRFWASVVITALFDSRRRHVGFAKVTRDLSERKRWRRASNCRWAAALPVASLRSAAPSCWRTSSTARC